MTVQVCGLPFLFALGNFAFLFGRGTLGYDRMGWGSSPYTPPGRGVPSTAFRCSPPLSTACALVL